MDELLTRPSTSSSSQHKQLHHQQYSPQCYTLNAAEDRQSAASSYPFAFGVPGYEDSSVFPGSTVLPSPTLPPAFEHAADSASPRWAASSSRPNPRPQSSRSHDSRIVRSKWEGSDLDTWVKELNGVKVVRRADGLVNGTKLLNCTNMTRGRRDGILKNEKQRTVIKVGSHPLKGVWIPLDRAQDLAQKYGLDDLWPLLEPDILAFQAAEAAYDSFSQQSDASSSRPSSTGSEMGYRMHPSTGLSTRQPNHDLRLSPREQTSHLPNGYIGQRHHSFSGASSQSYQPLSPSNWSHAPYAQPPPTNQLGLSLPPIYSIPTSNSQSPLSTFNTLYSQYNHTHAASSNGAAHHQVSATSNTAPPMTSAMSTASHANEPSMHNWYTPTSTHHYAPMYDGGSVRGGVGSTGVNGGGGGADFDAYLTHESWPS